MVQHDDSPAALGKVPQVLLLLLAHVVGRIAAELMGVTGVRIYHDQALIKEPGGRPTPWHQDHYYWPLDTVNTITMWLALVDIPPEMGSMSFATGTHRNPAFPQMPISEKSQETFHRLIHEERIPTPSYSLKAGDATFHSGDILHSAHGNGSPARREVLTVIYFADGTRVEVAYFLMSEDNVKLGLSQPWVALGSDEGSYAPEGAFLKFQPHPRAYGNFPRVLGKYVREEQVIPLEDAIRKMTSAVANL